MRILISGAGIAGPTLAYWLVHYGFTPTVVEAAPHLRTGGYIIDFWGAGFDIANRMGLLSEIRERGYIVREVRVVDRSNKRVVGFPTDAFSRTTGGRFVSLPRGDLAELKNQQKKSNDELEKLTLMLRKEIEDRKRCCKEMHEREREWNAEKKV